jgi:hypothetical protein
LIAELCTDWATGAQNDPTVARGVTLCIVELVDSRPMTKADEAAAGVGFRPGLWAWVLRRPRNVPCVPVVADSGGSGGYPRP